MPLPIDLRVRAFLLSKNQGYVKDHYVLRVSRRLYFTRVGK